MEIEQETLEKRGVACHPLSAKELLVVAQFDEGLLRLPLVLPLQMELQDTPAGCDKWLLQLVPLTSSAAAVPE